MKYTFNLPIRTVSEANTFEFWAVAAKRHKAHKEAVTKALNDAKADIIAPCEINLTRISPRTLDSDNLILAFKYIRDAIAEYIFPGKAVGRADDSKLLDWKYHQEKGKAKEYAIRIEITQ